jgi:group I intron endonuclease
MVGIYKITNPENKIYIGYSKNIERRFKEYLTLRCKTQNFLKNSFQKYGVENHIFEIIEECYLENIKEKEKYWIRYYNSYNNGLNSNKGGGGVISHSEKTKEKMSISHIGKKDSLETKIKKSNSRKGKKHINHIKGENHKKTGQKDSIETILKKKKPKPKNFGINHSLKTKGKPKHNDSSKMKISDKLKNHPSLLSQERKIKISDSNSKPVLQYDLQGNFIKEWSSSVCITKKLLFPQPNISAACLGKQKTAYGFIWRYK